jgi:hypothetical protein
MILFNHLFSYLFSYLFIWVLSVGVSNYTASDGSTITEYESGRMCKPLWPNKDPMPVWA